MVPIGRVVWSGAGCLVVPLMLLGVAVGAVVLALSGNRETWLTDACWVIGFLLSAVLIRVIGRRLNRFGVRHTLYGLAMQNYFWLAVSCAVLALGIVLLSRLAPPE